MIFDTHCHLGYDEDQDPGEVRQRADDAGVTMLMNVGIDLASSQRARSWAEKLDGVHYTAGLHPNHAGQFAEEWEEISALCREPGCRAVGETGLDFYREWTTPQQQAPALEAHLLLALELHKPSGSILVWTWVRAMTPFLNGYAALFLIGGAVYSAVKYARKTGGGNRALGNSLIAFGALLPGVGGGMAKAGIVEALYLGEFVGLIFIWAGYVACVRTPVDAS